MSKARKDKASLQSRLLQDSDEDEDIQYYKDAKDWGLTPRRKLDLLAEFDSEGGIGQWTRGSGLREKICSKQPDRFGTQETNPKLFKKSKNFATRFKSCQHKERKKESKPHQTSRSRGKESTAAATKIAAARTTTQATNTSPTKIKTNQDANSKDPFSRAPPEPHLQLKKMVRVVLDCLSILYDSFAYSLASILPTQTMTKRLMSKSSTMSLAERFMMT